MGIAFFFIAVKLVFVQGIHSQRYVAVGNSEWTQSVTLQGIRGAILDRNGDELAVSTPQTTIYADPHQVADPRVEAQRLAPALGIPAATLQADMSKSTSFVYLARTVSDATATKVAKLNLAGVYSLREPKRFYPAGQLASPLIGTVGTDNTGLSGLEYRYNNIISGTAGKLVRQVDPQGGQVAGGLQEYRAPVNGQDLVLTIDEPLQYDAEQALAQAIVAARAQSGIALLMDTRTGDILADAELTMPTAGSTQPPAVPVNIPSPTTSTTTPTGSTTPPAAPSQPVEAASATSFSQVYEPGSVNKLITISAALQEGVIKPTDMFTIPDSYSVAGTVFHDAESHANEQWNVTDILANSSNIGTIQIAQRLGKTDLLKYIHDYGLGQLSAVDFPGETPGLLPTYWSGTSIADVPIGQGISVTAMQMLAAYNTEANGGVYVAPRLVNATVDAHGHEHVLPPSPEHRVLSPTVAAEMTTMLDEVVRVGTGTAANLNPYTVAGKTGTGLVPSPTGGYERGHYVASFAGFVPAEKPAITAMVVINDTPDYGAAASAPTFATIARYALQELEIPPQPKQPPAPGVPLETTASATGAGEVAGSPLPGLASPPGVSSPTVSSPNVSSPSVSTTTTAPTANSSTPGADQPPRAPAGPPAGGPGPTTSETTTTTRPSPG